MKFPRWICISCGQPSGRKYNIKRHIRIRHNGIGAFVSFTDYLAGRQTGMYQPSSAPTYHSRTNSLDIFMEEMHRELARKLVNQNFPLRPTWNQINMAIIVLVVVLATLSLPQLILMILLATEVMCVRIALTLT